METKIVAHADPLRKKVMQAFRRMVGDDRAIIEGVRTNSDRTEFSANVKHYQPAGPRNVSQAGGKYKVLGRLTLRSWELI